MAVRFIIGRAGTGKTYTCTREIAALLEREPLGPPLLFIVPEQATYQVERKMALLLGRRGYTRLRVLSFSRLALTILAETGGLCRPSLSSVGRCMLLSVVLQQCQGSLHVFERAARQPGFLLQLDTTLHELAQYEHTPTDVASVAAVMPGSTGRKMADLAVVWEAYRQALAPNYADTDTYLARAAQAAEHCSLLHHARIWVDGFSGFTPQEHAMLAVLMNIADEVNLALCLDAAAMQHPERVSDPLGLFNQVQQTYARISQAIIAAQVKQEPPLLLSQVQRFQRPELTHLEREFTRMQPTPWADSAPGLHLVEAANRRTEVEAVAREIQRLCRQEGLRYRDMAVVTRQLEPYRQLIAAVFTSAGIPHFIDQRTPIAHHPVVEFIRSGMEAVLHNFAVRPLMRCLKTDLIPLDRNAVDKLENYLLKHGLRGGAWHNQEPWRYELSSEELNEEIDQNRCQIAALFQPLWSIFRQPMLLGQQGCDAILAFLQAAQVEQTLHSWAEKAVAAGQPGQALTHQQVWERLSELLSEVADILGEQELTPGQFYQVIQSGLESLQLGLIPPAVDQVLIGTVDRSRQPEIQAVFVLGLVEKEFPAAHDEDAVFSDVERELLAEHSFTLGASAAQNMLHEHYLGYIAFTRAQSYLWVSRPMAGEAGRELAPSTFMLRLQKMFPQVPVIKVGSQPPTDLIEALPWLTSPRQLAAALVRNQPASAPYIMADWQRAAQLLQNYADTSVRQILSVASYSNEERACPPTLHNSGAVLHTSISRLESFAACPFQHFAQHTLKLRPREEFRVQHTDIGLLVHETMHRFVSTLKERGLEWAEVPIEQANLIVDELVDKLAPRLRSEVFLSNARHRYLVGRVKRTMRNAIWALSFHASGGQFRPIATELGFGGPGDRLPAWLLSIDEEHQLSIQGRIDRVDIAHRNQTTYYRVVDFKGSAATFSLSDIHHGLRLQLIAYLQVVMAAAQSGYFGPVSDSKLMPAGAYYFAVREPLIDVTTPLDENALETKLLREMRMQGVSLDDTDAILLAESDGQGRLIPAKLKKDGTPSSSPLTLSCEQFSALLNGMQQRMRQLAQRILTGEIAISPYRYANGKSACRFCPYMPVCLFDTQLPGNRYRNLEYRENRRAGQFFTDDQEAV